MFMSGFIRTDYHAVQIFIPHRNRSTSAKRASSSNEGKSTGRYPARLRPANSRLSRVLSAASVKPHQAGEAYISEATEVILATRWSSSGRRPCDLKVRRENRVEAHVAIIRSM